MIRDIFSTNQRVLKSAAASAAALAIVAGSASIVNAASSNSGKAGSRTTKIATADRNFANDAAQGGATEVILGKLAQQNGTSADIKQFGQRMVTDHTKANKDLDNTAHQIGLDVNWRPNATDRSTVAKLAHLHGAAFDRAYAADMVKDHKKDVAAFEREAAHGQNPDIRSFAQRTLPVLRSHLSMAEAMASGKPSTYAHHMSTMSPSSGAKNSNSGKM